MVQVEELFQAMQLRKAPVAKAAAVKQLAVLELKRATAIGIRMAGLKCVPPRFQSAPVSKSSTVTSYMPLLVPARL